MYYAHIKRNFSKKTAEKILRLESGVKNHRVYRGKMSLMKTFKCKMKFVCYVFYDDLVWRRI